MALTINWDTKVITVPRADMQLVQTNPTEIRQLDINAFRLELKDIEDGEGMPYSDTHAHVAPVSVGGVTLARVVEILEPYTITFEDGQYQVNLVGANSNIADRTNLNQVGIRSANSAGLTFSDQINDQSFNGYVRINVALGDSGTQFPRGTQTDPVNNIADALTIAANRKLNTMVVDGTLATSSNHDIGGYTFKGSNRLSSAIVLANTPVDKASFEHMALTGAQGAGFLVAENCLLLNITNLEGGIINSVLNGTIQIAPAASGTNDTSFFDCVSGYPGDDAVEVDLNGTTTFVQFRRFSGKVKISNMTGGNKLSFESEAGNLELDATCTSGIVVIRGIVNLIDNSGPGLTVVHEDVLDGGASGVRIQEMWKKAGLDSANPVTATPSQITFDNITIDLTGDGVTTKTATRQP